MTTDLVKMNYEKEEPMILGRDLHEQLKINTPYRIWFPRMLEYGFIENKDYYTVNTAIYRKRDNVKMPNFEVNHYISIPMFIHICMLQKNEIGRKVRELFMNNNNYKDKELIQQILEIIQNNKQIIKNEKYLYIIEFTSKLIKMGITNNLDERIKSLQNSSEFLVSRQYLIGLLDSRTAFNLEKELYNSFKNYRKEGEYFGIDFNLVVDKLNEILGGTINE